MSWFPCLCGHASEQHYLLGTQRHGPCKHNDCSCKSFVTASKPPARPPVDDQVAGT